MKKFTILVVEIDGTFPDQHVIVSSDWKMTEEQATQFFEFLRTSGIEEAQNG